VGIRLRLAFHPQHLDKEHPLLIEDWLELIESGKQGCVNAMVDMCSDLHTYGDACRFIKKFSGIPIWELKTRTSIGDARVYFFWTTMRNLEKATRRFSAKRPKSERSDASSIMTCLQG
jgi:hypothetical protein